MNQFNPSDKAIIKEICFIVANKITNKTSTVLNDKQFVEHVKKISIEGRVIFSTWLVEAAQKSGGDIRNIYLVMSDLILNIQKENFISGSC